MNDDLQRDTDLKRMHDKMHKMVDQMIGREDSLVKTASPSGSMANTSYKTYRNSFLTLSDMKIPDDFREIFKWCRYFFKFDSLIGPIVRKFATFPITDYILNDSQEAEEDDSIGDDETSASYKFYETMFQDLNLHKHLIEIGYDYFLYGNCVILATPGTKVVKRRNPETGEIIEKKEVVWKSVQRLDPSCVRINRDPSTQEKIYYYEVPDNLRRVIRNKRPKEEYDRIPKIFKDAVEKNAVIRLNSKYVFHFSMPSESGDNGLWATPPMMHVLKLIMYTNILRQAQEAIAYEHIIPKRIYYFEPNATFDPSMNFGRVADDFALELKKQLNDPNYQVISPIPVNQLQHGGQGRNLLLAPEIDQLEKTILAGMNAPQEFIFGGVSYSGSTTSLRILENDFITYRASIEDYVNNFLIKKLSEVRGEWETVDDDHKLCKITFAELKMQDDIQQKELMVRINQAAKLPDEILYEKVLGLDASKVKQQLETEEREKIRHQMEMQMFQAELQMEMQKRMQAKGLTPPPQAAPEGAPPQGAEGQQAEQQPEQPPEQPQPQQQAQGNEQVSEQQIMQFAQHLASLSEHEVQAKISELPRDVQQRVMQYYNRFVDEKEMETDMRAYPDQRPPRREGGV